ncbi:MAG: ABC transporter permease subunit [Christensenellales bacterium]|jgi:peptide/nickel transport system permease protein
MSNTQSSKRKKSITGWFKRLFFPHKELSFMEEEALQSPMRLVLHNFFSKRLSRMGLAVFLLILLAVVIGPHFVPIDLSYQDNTQQHVAPGLNMLSIPDELKKDIKTIAVGTTFAVGVDNKGKLYIWGYTRITNVIDLKEIPEEVRNAHIVDVAVGYDHITALDDAGHLYTWGNTRLGQDKYPKAFTEAWAAGEKLNLTQIEAANQFTTAIDTSGKLYIWGNGNLNDIKIKKEFRDTPIQKVTTNINSYLILTEEGQAAYAGTQKTHYSRVPEGLETGVVDIASTAATNAALKSDGTLVIWGDTTKGEAEIPEHEGKFIRVWGGRYHYVALTDTGKLYAWGDNHFGQTDVPTLPKDDPLRDLYVGYYQNYAVTEKGELQAWGLRGYLMGTDHLGRDIFTRIINGGQVTMTVGAVSVVISLIIGVVMGGLAGYFGGRTDMLIMRIAEIIGGLPFLPFALILSAIIGTRISVEQRMYLIMVVLGVLSWPGLCRLVRAQIFAQREMEYITAAKALGVREVAIVFKHIIPNVISVILVSATLSFATSMLTESTLSYLGFGIAPPTPTWGNMLTGANDSIIIQQYWWRWVFTAIIFSICTICINLIGDGLRDAIDPKSNER